MSRARGGRVAAIVLAGGRSSRFGAAKLEADLDGFTLLKHALERVATIADEIVVAGPSLWPGIDGIGLPTRFIADDEPFAGPLAALTGALRATTATVAVVVGGDMPGLVPAVVEAMLERLASDETIDAVVLAPPPGAGGGASADPPRRQVLPLALRVGPAAEAAADAMDAGDRALVRLLDRLRFVEVPASDWLPLDPGGLTLLDVDTPGDLERVRDRQIR